MDHNGADPNDPYEGGTGPRVLRVRSAFFTTVDFYCGHHIPDGFEVFRMPPGSCGHLRGARAVP